MKKIMHECAPEGRERERERGENEGIRDARMGRDGKPLQDMANNVGQIPRHITKVPRDIIKIPMNKTAVGRRAMSSGNADQKNDRHFLRPSRVGWD